jgi:hypothetical protein
VEPPLVQLAQLALLGRLVLPLALLRLSELLEALLVPLLCQLERLVRLPLWVGLKQEQQAQVIDVISRVQA